jgi:hypothetical protein
MMKQVSKLKRFMTTMLQKMKEKTKYSQRPNNLGEIIFIDF